MSGEKRVKDIGLAKEGFAELEWARLNMPILARIRKEFEKSKPFKGLKIGTCLHLEKKTGILLEVLMAGGAKVAAAGCNPLTTDDRVAAAMLKQGADVFAWTGETEKEYYANIRKIVERKPHLVIDDGCDLTFALHRDADALKNVIGGCEETTTGILRLKAMQKDGALKFPIVSVNDAYSKFLFDNRYGTAQSTAEALMRATNKLVAGKTVVVVGYGWCGRGIASRMRGLGANVIVVELGGRLPSQESGPSGFHKALEALYEGNRVMGMEQAAKEGDIFITATGIKGAIGEGHLRAMKDGAILANAGHFNNEIDIGPLRRTAASHKQVKENVEMFTLKNGRRLFLVSEGRLVNLSRPSGQGHPIEIMDGSFAIQALSLEYVARNAAGLGPGVHPVPKSIDDRVAELALASQGIRLSKPSRRQAEYAKSWKEGT